MWRISDGAMSPAGSMEEIFGAGGILARYLSGYEPRPGQGRMAEAVAELLSDPDRPGCLAVEAETGLGKTLAYLVPAVLSGRRMVVSTNTRNLQDQILQHEIPFILQYIDPSLKALCVKGRQNYLCLYRWRQYMAGRQEGLFENDAAAEISAWLERTRHGDRSELPGLGHGSPLWLKICCLSHFCLGTDCPDTSACFLNRLRRDAAGSSLLVVNHHLFFSDIAVRRTGYGEVLPRYEAVVFDEAHHIENVATTFFGSSFTRHQALDLIADIERSAAGLENVMSEVRSLAGSLEQFAAMFPSEIGRFPLNRLLERQPEIGLGRNRVITAFERLAEVLEELDSRDEPWGQYSLRAAELAERLRIVIPEGGAAEPVEDARAVHWYERREKNLVLSATPVDVADDLQQTLFSSVRHTVFTSATLSAGGDFSYFLRRLGLPEETRTLSFPSPFDYAARTLLYVPGKIFPEPQGPGYTGALHDEIGRLIELSRGRALVLFTSIQAMEGAHRALRDMLAYPLLLQGTASRSKLLSRFSGEKETVLFAVASFWEGVDIPGESLSMVIIDKLPFEVPSDPVIMARINRIRTLGGNPFFDFQVPRAVLGLRQGLGRLMRCRRDRGVMAVLDVRLFTRGYGRRFLQSLPPSPLCRDLEEVEKFFREEDERHQDG
jgi:ATP-dependent DNA helicase DinG